jgi:hypothetical protein
MGTRHLGQPLRLAEESFPARCLGPSAGRAEQLVEHRDGQVGERRLALDDKGDEDGEPSLRREAQQLARVGDLRLAGEEAIAVGVDRLALLIGHADAAQTVEARHDAD